MRSFKYKVIFIIALLTFAKVAYGQTPQIMLLDNYFTCNACLVKKPPVSQKDILTQIAGAHSLQDAFQKILSFFTSEGDGFVLFCKDCETPKIARYVRRSTAMKKPERGFGTYLDLKRGGSQKGGEDFYTFNDLLSYITDSLLVFDSIELSTASIIGRDTAVFRSLRASYTLHGKTIERVIPYDTEKQSFTLSYNSLFGKQLTRSLTDTIPVTVSYYASDRQKKIVPGNLKVFFATAEEKEDLTQYIAVYQAASPNWSVEAMADELMIPITAKYKNASLPNLIEWLQKQH